ncbi:MAG: hypothetical protein EOO39_47945, partial [Cytophagaceae bacterium]
MTNVTSLLTPTNNFTKWSRSKWLRFSMKIRQIRFRNINSFYGEHEPIQFASGLLGDTGLFVISGPTGAGKS